MRVGLMIGRFSPFHNGHAKTMFNMIRDCEESIVLVGRPNRTDPLRVTSEYRTTFEPWTGSERRHMVLSLFNVLRFSTGFIEDIHTPDTMVWGEYVMKLLREQFTDLIPTDYYAGSQTDAIWMSDFFYKEHLHVIDRDHVSGTDIRTHLELGRNDWKSMVPTINHKWVQAGWDKFQEVKLMPEHMHNVDG